MTQKRNLSTEKIIEAAKEIINKERAEKLSFSKVAGVLGYILRRCIHILPIKKN